MIKLVYLSLGSNLGDRADLLEQAVRQIEKQVGVLGEVSGIYESEAWGFASKNRFCNCCLSVHTDLQPEKLLEVILDIERTLGRERTNSGKSGGGYSDRIIDIDILFYGDLILDLPGLVIPHPAMEERSFVLVPLNEIAPGLKHPVLGKTIGQMLLACEDQEEVWPLDHRIRPS